MSFLQKIQAKYPQAKKSKHTGDSYILYETGSRDPLHPFSPDKFEDLVKETESDGENRSFEVNLQNAKRNSGNFPDERDLDAPYGLDANKRIKKRGEVGTDKFKASKAPQGYPTQKSCWLKALGEKYKVVQASASKKEPSRERACPLCKGKGCRCSIKAPCKQCRDHAAGLHSKRYNVVQASSDFVVYRTVNGIPPEKVDHLISGKSYDAVFGKGTYFSFSKKDAKYYLDYTSFSLIIKYKITINRLLELNSGDKIIGLEKPSEGLTIFDQNLAEKLGNDSFSGDELVQRASKHFDAIALYKDEEDVDGGEQLIVIPKGNVTLKPISYDLFTINETKKSIPWAIK